MLEGPRATWLFGEARRQADRGRRVEALALLRRALGLLSRPGVNRQRPWVLSTLVSAAALAAQLLEEGGREEFAEFRPEVASSIRLALEAMDRLARPSTFFTEWRQWFLAVLPRLE